jgi:hypothetical protein
MPFEFADSFDYWTTMPGKWTGQYGTPEISVGNGRFGSNGLRIVSNTQYLTISVTPAATYYIGFAYKYSSSMIVRTALCNFINGSETLVGLGLLDTSHNLRIFTNSRDPNSGQTTLWYGGALVPDIWNYIEFMATIGDAGTYALRVNGVQLVNTTGDTKPGSATQINTVELGPYITTYGVTNNSPRYYDDFYLHTAAFQGDVHIQYRPPEGVGSNTDFIPSSSEDNYVCVDETPPSTVDYVSSDIPNDADTYVMQDVDLAAGSILAVIGNYYCQKVDSGSRQIAMTTVIDSNVLTSSGQAVPSSWGYLQFIQETKPGGGAWTVEDAKAAEMGMTVTA